MINFKDTVKFPFLVHRFEQKIENEIANLRSERSEIAIRLKRLAEALTVWYGQPYKGPETIHFVMIGDEMELLVVWGNQNDISPKIKIEKYLEMFDIPDFSGILEDANFLAEKGEDVLLPFVDEKSGEIIELETTKAEKDAIVEKHSVYIHNQRDYDMYVGLSLLCEAANVLNLKWNDLKGNRIEKVDLVNILPIELKKYILREQPEEDSLRRRLALNFDWFREQG